MQVKHAPSWNNPGYQHSLKMSSAPPWPMHGGSNLLWNQWFCFFNVFLILFTYYFLDCENSILFPDPDRCSLLFHNIFQTSNSKRPFKILKLSQTFKTLLEPCRPNRCTEYTMYSFHFFLCIFFSQELKRCFSAKGSHTCCKMQWLHRSSLFKAIKFASFVKTV